MLTNVPCYGTIYTVTWNETSNAAQFLSSGTYRVRWEEQRLLDLLGQMPVVVLTGARQVGKTTLLRHLEKSFQQARSCRYLSLDDLSVAQQARDDPRSLWEGYDLVIIDEVQRDPRLLPAIKAAVDEARWRWVGGETDVAPRFILSGSANLLLMQSVAESLAGRAAYLVLRPFTVGELAGDETPPPLLHDLFDGRLPALGSTTSELDPYAFIARGLMPGLHLGPDLVAPHVWWDGYVTTYLERDLRGLADVSSLIDFRRVMQALALRTGRLLNQAEVARDTAMSPATLSRWLNLLETGHLGQRLPAYFSNRGRRLLKMTRLFWTDAGLPCFLAGLSAPGAPEESREGGSLLENLVYHHLSVLSGLLDPPARLYHWRTQGGAEVDFVVEQGQALVAFEVKSARRVTYDDAKGLRAFLADHQECRAAVLVYRGREVVPLGSGVVALPWEFLARGGPALV
jgi:predicted AAA+ superfamily ATPase